MPVISLYCDAADAQPKTPIELSWADLVAFIRDGVQHTAPAIAPVDDSPEAIEAAWQASKRGLPGIVAAAFSGRRCNANAGPHTALLLDVDRPKPDTLERLQRYQAIAYESPSSRRKGPDDLRLKVAVVPTEPVPPHAVKAARSALARDLGLDPKACGVTQADAVSQLAFIGRVDGTPERQVWVYDGQPWTPPPPGDAPPEHELAEAGASEPLYGPEHVPDLSELAPLLEPEDPSRPPDKDTNPYRSEIHFCRGLGGMLAKRGLHPDAIEQAVFALHDGRSNQPGKRAELARQTAEQWYRTGKADTAGEGAVLRHVAELVSNPDDVITYIDQAALVDPWCQTVAAWLQTRSRPANDAEPAKEPAQSDWPGPGPTLHVISAAEIAQPLPPVDWLCERLGLAVGGRPNLFAAAAGGGKTTSAQALALAVASGTNLFGDPEFACRQGSVLHLDIDQGSAATKRRYQRLAAGAGLTLAGLPLACGFEPLALARREQIDDEAVKKLGRTVKGYDLVIVDSLRALAPGLDEQSSEFGNVLHALQHITYHLGTTWLVIHHSGKGETSAVRGTSAIRDRAGCVWVIDDGGRWRHDKVSELSETKCAPFTTAYDSSAYGGLEGSLTLSVVQGDERPTGAPTRAERDAVLDMVRQHPDGVSGRQVLLELKSSLGRNRVDDIICVMLESGELFRTGSARQGTSRLHTQLPAQ